MLLLLLLLLVLLILYCKYTEVTRRVKHLYLTAARHVRMFGVAIFVGDLLGVQVYVFIYITADSTVLAFWASSVWLGC